jgi:hypothetical protein
MGSRSRYQMGERSLGFDLGFDLGFYHVFPLCSHQVPKVHRNWGRNEKSLPMLPGSWFLEHLSSLV